jgi:hypothetical protein
MDLTWLADTVEQCRAAGVPWFDELWIREVPKGDSRPETSFAPSLIKRRRRSKRGATAPPRLDDRTLGRADPRRSGRGRRSRRSRTWTIAKP